MSTPLRPARLDWSQGQPASADFGDIYFSRDGGDAECRHVFLDGNRLADALASLGPIDSLTVVETGFGTGLNWLCTQAMQAECGKGWLHYVSIEKHPLNAGDLQQAQACWPAYARFAQLLQAQYPALVPGFHRLVFPELKSTLTLVFADVDAALPRLVLTADIWFLDGFAPAKNPQMWSETLFQQMARLSRPGSRFATFTAAGSVRRGLQAAGFAVSKRAGFGRKREMLCGEFVGDSDIEASADTGLMPSAAKPWLARPRLPAIARTSRRAVVIGAGIAGASSAHALAVRGWQVTVLEAGTVAGAASGNPAALVKIHPAPEDEALDHFPQQASLMALRQLRPSRHWQPCGVLELPAANRQKHFAPAHLDDFPTALWQRLDAAKASQQAGLPITTDAAWQPASGLLNPAAYCAELLGHSGIRLHEHSPVATLSRTDTGWQALDPAGEVLAEAPVLILANSLAALDFLPTQALPLRCVRGQISRLSPTPETDRLRCALSGEAYLTPALADGSHCLGASFVPDDASTELRDSEHEDNLTRLCRLLPAASALTLAAIRGGRSSLRCQSPDYLPLLGPVPDAEQFRTDYAGLRDGKSGPYPGLRVHPGLYAHLAHGSHGFAQAGLAAEILASEINNEPAPISGRCLETLHPARFFLRDLKRGRI